MFDLGLVSNGLALRAGLVQVVSYHTHIPHYIPQYTWDGLVEPMWKIIRFCTLMADLTLVPSNSMKVAPFPFCEASAPLHAIEVTTFELFNASSACIAVF